MDSLDNDVTAFLFWSRNVAGHTEATIRARGQLLEQLATYLQKPLRDATDDDLRRFELTAIAGRAVETRRTYACHIRAFYRYALTMGLISDNPSLVLTLPRVPRRQPRPISEDDLLRAMEHASPKMRAMFTLGAYAGLRCIEIAGLEWVDLRRSNTDTSVHVRFGKGRKERTVTIGQVVQDALAGHGIRRKGPMFLGKDGGQITAHSVSTGCNRFLARHGIDSTMHQMRHRYGVVGYEITRDIRLLQEQMGHSSPTSTAIYTRPTAEAAAAMVAAMDRLAITA